MSTIRRAFSLLILTCAPLLTAQAPAAAGKEASPAADTGPIVVDVHASPYRAKTNYTQNIGHHRFDMRDATILDLIAFAYDRRDDTILGGPTWIDLDRFDASQRRTTLLEPQKFSPRQALEHPPLAKTHTRRCSHSSSVC